MSRTISASRRTDIPAFYSEWFMDKIRAGYCTVPNPFNAKQVSYVSLKPQDVRAIVFWTRDPRPHRKMTVRMDREISAYGELIEWIGKKAGKAGIEAQSCAEEADLEKYGIRHGRCIDGNLITRITGLNAISRKDPHQRKLCGCVISKDIGVNNTCLFGCKYCYATSNIKTAKKNFKGHDKNSPSLTPMLT